MTTYAVLQSDIASTLLRDDLTSAIPTFIRMCEASIRRDVRVRAMETTVTLSIEDGAADVPSDYIEMRRLILDDATTWNLEYVPPEVLYSSNVYLESGTPAYYTIEGDSIIFRPKATDSALMAYVAAFDALSAGSDTNWLLTNAYDVYLYGSLIHTAPYLKEDARIAVWQSLYGQAVASVNKMDQRGRFSGSPLRVRGGETGP